MYYLFRLPMYEMCTQFKLESFQYKNMFMILKLKRHF